VSLEPARKIDIPTIHHLRQSSVRQSRPLDVPKPHALTGIVTMSAIQRVLTLEAGWSLVVVRLLITPANSMHLLPEVV